MPNAAYETFHKTVLVRLLRKRDAKVGTLLKKVKQIRQQLRRLRQSTAGKQNKEKKGNGRDIDDTFHVKRRGKLRLTDQAIIALGLRRNFSHVNTKVFGSTLLEDVSQQTINRCEEKVGTSLLAAMRKFHKDSELDRKRVPQREEDYHDDGDAVGGGSSEITDSDFAPLSLAIHAFRSDATNSQVWRKNTKLMSTQLESGYTMLCNGMSSDIDALDAAISRAKGMADIVVVDQGTG